MARRPSKGRFKTQRKRIKDEKDRSITLSKRCNGLFKKASEISTLCGVHIVIIIFSVGGKPVSFGSPSIGSVVKKFLKSNGESEDSEIVKRIADFFDDSTSQELQQQFDEVNERLVKEKKLGKCLEKQIKASYGGKTYEEYVESLGVDELMQLRDKLKELKVTLEGKSDSSSDEHEADLSKIGGPKDFLKL